MTLDKQQHKYHSKLYVKAYDLKKILDERTLEMDCICCMIQQVLLDDTWMFGCEFGADRITKQEEKNTNTQTHTHSALRIRFFFPPPQIPFFLF